MLPAPFFTEWPHDMADHRSFMAKHPHADPAGPRVWRVWLTQRAQSMAARSRCLAVGWWSARAAPRACA
jgi:hypothetical protein